MQRKGPAPAGSKSAKNNAAATQRAPFRVLVHCHLRASLAHFGSAAPAHAQLAAAADSATATALVTSDVAMIDAASADEPAPLRSTDPAHAHSCQQGSGAMVAEMGEAAAATALVDKLMPAGSRPTPGELLVLPPSATVRPIAGAAMLQLQIILSNSS